MSISIVNNEEFSEARSKLAASVAFQHCANEVMQKYAQTLGSKLIKCFTSNSTQTTYSVNTPSYSIQINIDTVPNKWAYVLRNVQCENGVYSYRLNSSPVRTSGGYSTAEQCAYDAIECAAKLVSGWSGSPVPLDLYEWLLAEQALWCLSVADPHMGR